MMTEEQIRQLVAENERLRAANESLSSRLEKSESRVQEQVGEIADLKYQMGLLRRKLYGTKSERHLSLDPDVLQGNLFSGIELPEDERRALDAEIAAMEARNARAVAPKAPRHRGAGKPMFSALDVEETHIYPDYPEGSSADDYVEIGAEQTDTIAVRPAKMYIKRVIRHKMVLRSSLQIQAPDRQAFLIAPLPSRTLPKSMADESVLADIIINKYLYHLPFHRQIEKYKELGVILSSSTVGDWFEAVCDRLRPLYDRLRQEIMKTDYIQVDESNVPIIDNEKRKAVKGYMWVVRDMAHGMSYFHYDGGSRSAEVARRLIGGYRGAMQTDGYEVYENDDRKLMLGCWAHARRRFVEALNYDRRHASEALVYIGKLYDIEREMKEAGLEPEAIRERRLRESVPVMDKFDLQIKLNAFSFDEMSKAEPGEPSAAIRERVVAARKIQEERYKDYPGVHCNAQMTERMITEFAQPDEQSLKMLRMAMEKLHLSARAYNRILKVARTIADLDNSPNVQQHHIAEAVGYRNLNRGDWAER